MYKRFRSGNLKETDKLDDPEIHGLPRMMLKWILKIYDWGLTPDSFD